jgi:uncharacterized paraquat-inducible protein A
MFQLKWKFVSSYKVSLSGYIIKFPVLLVDHSILCPRCHQIFFQDSMKPLLLTRISLSLLRNTTKKLHTAIELHDNYSTEGPRRNAVHVLFLKSIIFLMTKIYILLLSKWYDAGISIRAGLKIFKMKEWINIVYFFYLMKTYFSF